MFTPEQNKEIVVDFYDRAFNRNQPKCRFVHPTIFGSEWENR